MAKMNTRERRAFYLRSLEDQRHLLRNALTAMGNGDLIAALNVAICIRVLVHETPRCIPLLKTLRPNYLDLRIRTMSTPRPEAYSRFASPMTIMHLPFGVSFSPSEPRIFLKLDPDMSDYVTCGLGDWWNRPVLKIPGCSPLSRREIVLGVADKEGAHADDDMNENYRRVLESEPLKFNDGTTNLPMINVTRFAVGSAGIELLKMLDDTFPQPEDQRAVPD